MSGSAMLRQRGFGRDCNREGWSRHSQQTHVLKYWRVPSCLRGGGAGGRYGYNPTTLRQSAHLLSWKPNPATVMAVVVGRWGR